MQIHPWDTRACCWDIKQPANKQNKCLRCRRSGHLCPLCAVKSYQWLRNWYIDVCTARHLAVLGHWYDWLAQCHWTVTQIFSLVFNFHFSTAACKAVWADLSPRCTLYVAWTLSKWETANKWDCFWTLSYYAASSLNCKAVVSANELGIELYGGTIFVREDFFFFFLEKASPGTPESKYEARRQKWKT